MRRQFQNWMLFSFLLQNHLSGFESDDTIRYCFDPTIPRSMLIQTWSLKCHYCSQQFPPNIPSYGGAILCALSHSWNWPRSLGPSYALLSLIQVIYFSTSLFIDSYGIAASLHHLKVLHVPSGVYMLFPDALPASWWVGPLKDWDILKIFLHLQGAYTHF